VSDTAPLSKVLDIFLEQHQHIAMVINEYGEAKGLLTLEDLVETLLGEEIVDEGDKVADMRELARKRWQRRAKRMGIEV
jgi:CBS domain containing-hemolysin-like protein